MIVKWGLVRNLNGEWGLSKHIFRFQIVEAGWFCDSLDCLEKRSAFISDKAVDIVREYKRKAGK